jgi:FKBP-type peptidyl-prolyl cis-trans isomerase
MKFKLTAALSAAGLLTISALAGGSSPAPSPADAPDQAKLSYAVGTRLGLQIQDVKSRIDTDVAIQAIQDVLDGKPTLVAESDLGKVLNKGRSSDTGDQAAEDKKNFSYAGGMRAAMMFKRNGFDLDSKIVCDAIRDELQGKSKMEESETMQLFKQAAGYQLTKKAFSNKAEGDVFLAKNAKAPGVTVLPDGLQYQIVQAGDGPLATTNDLIFVKYSGNFISGTEFEHHNHFLTRIYGGIAGWREVLPQMKVGSEWKIFVPPSLAFGDQGLASRGIPPAATLVYDIQLLSIAPPGGTYQVNSGLGHGSDIDNN